MVKIEEGREIKQEWRTATDDGIEGKEVHEGGLGPLSNERARKNKKEGLVITCGVHTKKVKEKGELGSS